MSNEFYINDFSLNLTGTNFGLLDRYSKTDYLDGYKFINAYGDANFTYPLTSNGGRMFETYSESEVKNLGNLIFWLDVGDTNTIQFSSNSISTIVLNLSDKSNNKYVFSNLKSANTVLTAFWPVDRGYNTLTQEYINTNFKYLSSLKKCLWFGSNKFLSCSSLKLNYSKPFSLYFVWKNNTNFSLGETIEQTVPFSFITYYNAVTSEIVSYTSKNSSPNYILGLRDVDELNNEYGFKIDYLSAYGVNFNTPHVYEYVYDGSFVNHISAQRIYYNGNVTLSSDDTFLIPGIFGKTNTTTIGYENGGNTNNFYFCETLAFERKLTKIEREKLLNTIFNKWSVKEVYDNFTFNKIISGGSFKNSSYEDYSQLTTHITIPVQSCNTLLTISLTGYDETVSKIKKIIYQYNNTRGEVTASVFDTIQQTGSFSYFNDREIKILLEPSKDEYITPFTVNLTVIKYDGTENKIVISGSITKCGILDIFENTNLIDSQITNNINKNIVVLENKNYNQLFFNNVNVGTDEVYVSGGDYIELKSDAPGSSEVLLTLADLLDLEEETEVKKYKLPYINQPVTIEANPLLFLLNN